MAEQVYRLQESRARSGFVTAFLFMVVILAAIILGLSMISGVLVAAIIPPAIYMLLPFLLGLAIVSARRRTHLEAVRLTNDEMILDYGTRRSPRRLPLAKLRKTKIHMRDAMNGTLRVYFGLRGIRIDAGDAGVLWALRRHLDREIQARANAGQILPEPEPSVFRLSRRSHVRPRLRSTLMGAEQAADAKGVQDDEVTPALELKSEIVPEKDEAAPEEPGDEEEQRWRSI